MTMEEIHRDLGRVEAKVDLILARQQEISERQEAHGLRVTKVENDVASTKTLGSVGAVVLTALAAIFPTLWTK